MFRSLKYFLCWQLRKFQGKGIAKIKNIIKICRNKITIKKIKINYAKAFINNIGLVDPKTYVYRFVFYKEDSKNTHILQYFSITNLLICKKQNRCVELLVIKSKHDNTNCIKIRKVLSLFKYIYLCIRLGICKFNKSW